MKVWDRLLTIVVLAGFALIPAIFDLSVIHYVAGVVSVIAILIALAFFIMKTGTPIPDGVERKEPEDDKQKTKWQKCKQSIRRCWMKFYNACNNVGFILFLCILLIIGIGVFDSMALKNNEVGNECKCNHKTVIVKYTTLHTDSLQSEQIDSIR